MGLKGREPAQVRWKAQTGGVQFGGKRSKQAFCAVAPIGARRAAAGPATTARLSLA